MRVLVSTVRRHTPPNEASGYLYVVDLEKEQVLQRSSIVEPAYKHLDTNPRGGLRGCKGISIRDDQIAIANSMMVFRFNPDWKLLGLITNPSGAFIHDILFQNDTLWITSAFSDLLVQFDLSGKLLNSYYLRELCQGLSDLKWNPPLLFNKTQIKQELIDFRNPAEHDHILYDKAHVNSIGILMNGDILVSMGFIIGEEFASLLRIKVWLIKKGYWTHVQSFNNWIRTRFSINTKTTDNTLVVRPAKARSAVLRISPDGGRELSLVVNNLNIPSHSLLVLNDQTVIYLITSESKILRYEPISGKILSSRTVEPGFLRGVGMLSDSMLIVGNKHDILKYELDAERVISTIRITNDPLESVYDVKLLPDHYAVPPESFAELVAQTTGMKTPEELISLGSKNVAAQH